MNNFEKILEITSDKKAELSKEFKEQLHKELCLGMTRFVCRHGTLSDGFDKLTDAQRYYQAIREAYGRSNELKRLQANAKEAEADFLEAQYLLEAAAPGDRVELLRAEAKVEKAELRLFELLVSAEDTMRQLDEFNNIRLELMPKVRAQYPEGIEQAELDSWRAVAEYKAAQKQMGLNPGPMNHLPLPIEEKAKIGVQTNSPEMTLWYTIQNKDDFKNHIEKDKGNLISFLEKKLEIKEGK